MGALMRFLIFVCDVVTWLAICVGVVILGLFGTRLGGFDEVDVYLAGAALGVAAVGYVSDRLAFRLNERAAGRRP